MGWVTLAATTTAVSATQGELAGESECASDTCGRRRTCVLSVSDQRPRYKRGPRRQRGNCALTPPPARPHAE